MMPSRRDYDPVDEDPPGENNGSLRSAYEEIPVVDHESAPQDVDASHLSSSGVEEPNEDAIDSSNGMKVRVLDVHGEAYWVSVTPETTVQELKEKLVQLSGVEITRQRIIYGGKILGDADTLASRKVCTGAAMHLFRRPKATALSAAVRDVTQAGSTPALQTGGVPEIPSNLLRSQDSGVSGIASRFDGYLDAHMEVNRPRRGIRCLASCLLLVSIMQFMEFMARILSSVPADGDRGDGSGSPEEDVNLLHVRNIASVIGVIVGILGIRASHSVDSATLRFYYVGLILCAILAISVRIEGLINVILWNYNFETGDNSDGNDPDNGGDDGGGTDGAGESDGSGADGEEGSLGPLHQTRTTLVFNTSIAAAMLFFSTGIWWLCISRVRSMRAEIMVYLDEQERRQRERQGELRRLRRGHRLTSGTANETAQEDRGGAEVGPEEAEVSMMQTV